MNPTTSTTSTTNSFTPYIIAIISVLLILMFAGAILIYFLVFNNPPTHEITLKNNSNSLISVLIGAYDKNGNLSTHLMELGAKISTIIYVTPGVNLIVSGSLDGVITINGNIVATTVLLNLASNNFNGTGKIIIGDRILTNFPLNDLSIDEYGVSIENGYSIPITLESTAFNNKDLANTFSCGGPVWNTTIPGTGPNHCPVELQYQGVTGYLACQSACVAGIEPTNIYCCVNTCAQTGGCESLWPNQNYYNVFANACPTCMITNCDNTNYSCESNGGLTSYTITFL